MTVVTNADGFPWPWRHWVRWKAELEAARVSLRAELDQVQRINEKNRRALQTVRQKKERTGHA